MAKLNISFRRQNLFDPNQFVGSLLVGLVGGIAAGLVAGIASRASMRGVALLAGLTPDFSIDGTLFVILAGVILGGLGGMVYGFLLPFLPGPVVQKGFWFGGLLAGSLILIILFAELEGELALVSRWGVIALFAPLPLMYGLMMGWVAARIIPQEIEPKKESLHLARTAGLLTVIFALTGAVFELVLAVTHPAISNLGYDTANFLRLVAGGATLLMIFTGVAGLLRSGATGKSLWVKLGMGYVLMLVALLGFGTISDGASSMGIHGLVRVIDGIESNRSSNWLGVAVFALAIFSLIWTGIAVLRNHRWSSWQVYSPLLAGLSPTISLLLLYPSLFPALLKLSPLDRAELEHWVAALFALFWLALGWALLRESDILAPERSLVRGSDLQEVSP